jgi:transcriptional regulator with XRE-family HTH domain
MSPQEAFVTRLRRYRQKNRISLDEIAADTRVKRELLEALENNDLSQWPRGVYARAWIRTYAATVGLDPAETVDEFCRLFPHGDRRASGTIREMAAIVASPSEYRDEFELPEDRRRRAGDLEIRPKPVWHAPMTQSARVLWARLTTLAGPHLRARRAPRTSS